MRPVVEIRRQSVVLQEELRLDPVRLSVCNSISSEYTVRSPGPGKVRVGWYPTLVDCEGPSAHRRPEEVPR